MDHAQAGIVAFHDHVEENHRNFFRHPQQGHGLGSRTGMKQGEWAIEDDDVGESEARRFMHARIVVHHQDSPRTCCPLAITPRPIFLDEDQLVIQIVHCSLLSVAKGMVTDGQVRSTGPRNAA
ncbi:MAG: hypothetical protein AW09_003811 [Candidatus Accumulibacter phosphatis]|uniref:Uncharacterized protein n=1 Tax=Candidatus Accumulibacter phosphatis TaxID=327160 RepID=A0A080LS19_9PROT|nr:MAG: hypothetical protein AW09_003811 [Candidatus Accumulibacter phosphatis]